MARIDIPGTRTLWSVIRGYLNSMFTEIYAKLFETGKVLSDNNYTTAEKNKLATLTDEVIEYANFTAFPVIGISGILYVALDTGYLYRWTGSVYTETSASVSLGETSVTAYRGDRGKAAYDHSQDSSIHVTTQNKSDLALVTLPNAGTLTTGSNAIDLTNLAGKEYNPYDMASGALTLTVAANPVRAGNAYGILIADGSTTPNVSAFTLLSGSYVNTNDVQNHFFISYKYNGSGILTAYLQWLQPS